MLKAIFFTQVCVSSKWLNLAELCDVSSEIQLDFLKLTGSSRHGVTHLVKKFWDKTKREIPEIDGSLYN